jgi:hypothetical protein
MSNYSPNSANPSVMTPAQFTRGDPYKSLLMERVQVPYGTRICFHSGREIVIPHSSLLPCRLSREACLIEGEWTIPDPAGIFRMAGQLFTRVERDSLQRLVYK